MFKKKISPFTCIILCITVCLVTFVGVYSHASVKFNEELQAQRLEAAEYAKYGALLNAIGEDADKYTKLTKMFDLIESAFVHESDSEIIWESMFRALVESLGDQHSVYLTSDEFNAVVDSGKGNFVGIGVHATYDPDTEGIYIFGVIPNSPAEKAGIKAGDIIVAVEGETADSESYYEVLDLIRGESGTQVVLTVKRGEETLEIASFRASVASQNVIYEQLEEQIAYIRILSFADSTVSEQFNSAIVKAKSDGCDKFIFDVRNNGGGYLDEICDVLDTLLPEGPIINIVYKTGEPQVKSSDAQCLDAKMAVLCNENTASAAELFAAALRDYELADIIGTKTFGKGTMQVTTPLTDGSAIKLSSAFYNPPSNVSYDGIGVIPQGEMNVELPEYWQSRFFKMQHGDDTQLQKAISVIKNK